MKKELSLKSVDTSTPIQFKGVVYNEMKGQTVSYKKEKGK